MCGIAGMAGMRPDREVLADMGAAIAHRGPDDATETLWQGAGFSFRRLSIIDVAGGRQPIFNEDETAAIILNGEIYNHHRLRDGLLERGHRFRTRSDVETVLHLWEEQDLGCLQHLRGMFALAIWDERRQSLFLARDRLGKKPLYYHQLPSGAIAFGSEIKAILQLPGVPRTPDPGAIDEFLTLQYVPSPRTAFAGIHRLPPAHWLLWRDGQISTGRYWNLDFDDKLRGSEAELREEAMRLLRESVRLRLESEVPLGAFLSGGVDSSAVVALAAEALPGRLNTFSIGFDEARFDESQHARLVAEHIGTDHHELRLQDVGSPDLMEDIVWHYDQPFGDSSAVPSYHVARITRPHVTVVLNGDGGDESFAGYDRYRLSRFSWFFRLPRPLRSGMFTAAGPLSRHIGRARRIVRNRPADAAEAYFGTLTHLWPARKSWLYTDAFAERLSAQPAPPLAALRSKRHVSLLDAMLETDINHYLPDDLLVKMDVATMAHSLEARSPFLDHRFVEFMARVPGRYKLAGGTSKYLLKSALRDLLPAPILQRPKMGFGIPLATWLRTSLRELLQDSLGSQTALARGYFRAPALRQMIDEHMSGTDEHQYLLWDLLMLELWHRRFIDAAPLVRAEAVGSLVQRPAAG
jgi:asparagine synthase (glutamine-hydrolysing)